MPKNNDICTLKCLARVSYVKFTTGLIRESEILPPPTDFSNPNFTQPYVHSSNGKFLNGVYYSEVAEALNYADETEMFEDVLERMSLVQAVNYFKMYGFRSTTQSIRKRCYSLLIKIKRQKTGEMRPVFM